MLKYYLGEEPEEREICVVCGTPFNPIIHEKYCSGPCKYELEDMEKESQQVANEKIK